MPVKWLSPLLRGVLRSVGILLGALIVLVDAVVLWYCTDNELSPAAQAALA